MNCFWYWSAFIEDIEYTMSKVGMSDDHLLFHENISKGDSTESLAIDLFSKLPKNLTEQLYELYKIDFEMFEYDSKPYMGKPRKKPKPKIKVIKTSATQWWSTYTTLYSN